ncbi:SRPBCC family protein [Streptomyces actinomycinicus]|uniref:SRPBCC family protein n=1 Tax=Streptomyces actinomycinicus TaxID=1695166 RepID=A0A937JLQ3_9ACTN|nr:SRPBCC family protein [Streptomyces actinomycinicus]MBL1083874.1 SRPBCC family protein [Streptomyces actinomycinicus]
MSETLGSARSTAGKAAGAAKGSPLTDLAHSEAADRLKAEAQEFLSAQATKLLTGFGRKLGETTGKLNDIAEGNSPGFAKLALDGGRKLAEGKGPLRTALELGASRAKENVMDAVRSLGGSKGKKGKAGKKPTVIMESVDVGVPQRTAYDQWTQYQDFSTFAKGVKSANRADDTHSDWQAKIFWSTRSWKAQTTEQIPDYRIQWTSEGAKGTTKGVVSFHRLEENLTRVLLVMEYYPTGLFEKTGNIWRAQGRRARLDLKNFARFITIKGEAEDSWRGEIRDGEVVRSHEDAEAEEAEEKEREAEGQAPEEEDEERPEEADEEREEPDEEEEEPGEDEEEPGEDEEGAYEDEEEGPYEDEDEAEAEEGEEEAEPAEDSYEDEGGEDEEYEEEEPEYAERGSRR